MRIMGQEEEGVGWVGWGGEALEGGREGEGRVGELPAHPTKRLNKAAEE